jgi:outer membrane protein OmpA-like peptidoglycan-associated protein
MLSLTAGFTFHLGKVGWKRAVDTAPYIHWNELLVDYGNFLSEENRRYVGRHNQDKRTLVELKKILEIEGLLDTYSHIFDNDDITGCRYPINNYSGLNSLRARLKHSYWDGSSPLDTTILQTENGKPSYNYTASRNVQSAHQDTLAMDSTVLSYADGECIGTPIYFFFALNTTHLTDTSQRLNLDELARVAKKYSLSVRVTGAADSSTGTSSINDSLSISRAGFITAELEQRGIPAKRIIRVSKGGIADYTPVEANRHTKVELFFPKAK